jgi:hypothetical protein
MVIHAYMKNNKSVGGRSLETSRPIDMIIIPNILVEWLALRIW